MNPPDDIKLVGVLTEQQFLSLMNTDEEKTPEQNRIINGISKAAKDAINFDYLMRDSNKPYRNILLLTYLLKSLEESKSNNLNVHSKRQLRAIVSIFENQFQVKKQLDTPHENLIAALREKLPLTDDELFAELDEEFVKIGPTEPKPEQPQRYSFLSPSNLLTTAKSAANTYLTQNWGKPHPLSEVFEKNDNYKKVDNTAKSTIEVLLRPGAYLNDFSVLTVMTLFDDKYNRNKRVRLFDSLPGPLVSKQKTIENREPSRHVRDYLQKHPLHPRYLLIPFPYTSHIVMIAVDFEKKQVMYYDSQGLSSSQRREYSGFDMRKDLEDIKNICFPDDNAATICDSSSVHQEEDKHNCGVYILHFADALLGGESFSDIQKKPIPGSKIESIRTDYAKEVFKYFPPGNLPLFKEFLEHKYNLPGERRQFELLPFYKATPSAVITSVLTKYRKEHSETPKFLFLPVKIPEKNNTVLIAIDFAKKTIMYFDSQGENSDQKVTNILMDIEDFNMRAELNRIKTQCFGPVTGTIRELSVDRKPAPLDMEYYLLHYAESLLKGQSYEDIQNNPVDIHKVRRDYAYNRYQLFPQELK